MAAPRRHTPAALASFAAHQLAQRMANARAALRAGRVDQDRATEGIAAWRAIALLAGADLSRVDPQLEDALADLRVVQLFPGGAHASRSEDEAREILAADCCPPRRWAAYLARQRDRALEAADGGHPTALETARLLQGLSDLLELRIPYLPREPLPHELETAA